MDFQRELEHVTKITEKDPYLGLSRSISLLDKYSENVREYVAKRRLIQCCFLFGLGKWFERNYESYGADISKFLDNIANREKFIEKSLLNKRTKSRNILESQKIFYDTVKVTVENMVSKKNARYAFELVRKECENNAVNFAYWKWLKEKLD